MSRAERLKPGYIEPIAARSIAKVRARIHLIATEKRPILTVASTYDRAALIVLANAHARSARAHGDERPWSELMASGLRSAWLKAKFARSAAAA